MNLDELTKKIRIVSEENVVQKLADYIQEWKTDERNAVDLRNSVEKYLGNVWIDKQTDFEEIYGMWSEFRKSAIEGIGGMTMNERLYLFGLLDLFDKASKDKQQKIYSKLMAKQ
jgi:hypothetical protein